MEFSDLFKTRRAIRATAMVVVVVAFIAVNCGTVSAESRHKVGGSLGWTPGNNFTVWSSNERVYVGDWLLFVFDKMAYDVLEVNETSYEACNSQGFIANITKGGRDVYQLKETKTYYFICGKGYCWGGMKVAVNVTEPPAPAPASAPSNSTASTNLLGRKSWSGAAGLVMLVSWVFGVMSL